MKGKTYRVYLTGDEERHLKDIVSKGVHLARQVRVPECCFCYMRERTGREIPSRYRNRAK